MLGSINLAQFVKRGEFDFEDFLETVGVATRYLNDVLEEGMARLPLEEQRETVMNWKQIGLGIMGLADMLIELGIPYSSKEARQLCGKIGCAMINGAVASSALIAKNKGAYPKYNDKVRQTLFYEANITGKTDEFVKKYGLRNSQLLTIAPTGTISTMLGISGGIEPIFANSYTRKTESLHGHDEYYKVYTPIVEKYMKAHGLVDENELPAFFETSATIKPIDRVAM